MLNPVSAIDARLRDVLRTRRLPLLYRRTPEGPRTLYEGRTRHVSREAGRDWREDLRSAVAPLLRTIVPGLPVCFTIFFDPGAEGEGWDGFLPIEVFVPRTAMRDAVPRGDDADAEAGPPPHERFDARACADRVQRALEAIAAGTAEKIVVAAAADVDAERPFDAAAIVAALERRYPSCHVYALHRGGRCFLGATPEPLARVRAGRVSTVALAGSLAPGAPLSAFERDEKIAREHAVVVDAVRAALDPLCVAVDTHPPDVVRLANVAHLRTRIDGTLREGMGLLDAVAALHPTPALAGHPRDAALRWIAREEGFHRGLYGGVIGTVDDRGEGEAIVAIRCAFLDGNHARLFAGAGVVAGSDPDAETAEIRAKMHAVLSALVTDDDA